MIQQLWQRRFRVGDRVVFRKSKHGTAPGPRAKHIAPSRFGEEYNYQVDKFWVVEDVQEQSLVLRTRRGKRHTVHLNDQRLRPAHWWELIFFRNRFPLLDDVESQATDPQLR